VPNGPSCEDLASTSQHFTSLDKDFCLDIVYLSCSLLFLSIFYHWSSNSKIIVFVLGE